MMKKLIVLVLILVITPFFIVSDDTLNSEVEKIKLENIKNPEFKNWEYVKDRVFSKDGVLEKGYDKPVIITLDRSATDKDSLIVSNFIEELKLLIPSIIIGFELPKEVRYPFHYIDLDFRTDSIRYNRFLIKDYLKNGNTIGKTRPGFITTSDGSKHSFLNFEFQENITDQYRRSYIEFKLLKTIFLTNNMFDSFNNLFSVNIFNDYEGNYLIGRIGGVDEFLLQKVYSPDFLKQFQEYLDANYPWRYAYSFLHKKETNLIALAINCLLGIVVFLLMFNFFQNRKFRYLFLNYFVPVLLVWMHFVNLNHIYSYFTNFNTRSNWDVSIAYMVLVMPIFALLTSFIMWVLDKILIKENARFSFQLVQKVLYTFIAFMVPILLVFFFDGHQEEGVDFFFPELFFWIALAFGRGLLIYLNHFSDSLIKQKDVELSQLKEVNAQAEVKLLQSQINPHFLYNALNSIATLARKDGEKTEQMALSLSDLFKYTINRKGKKNSTIKDEVEMVQNYLEIEQIRFGDRLQFSIEVPTELESVKIPMFIIQPLIENTVKHGISKNEENGEIALKIEKTTNGINILVEDNGPGFPDGLVSGHGLQTVYDLLRLSYGDDASIQWQNEPQKRITINIIQNL